MRRPPLTVMTLSAALALCLAATAQSQTSPSRPPNSGASPTSAAPIEPWLDAGLVGVWDVWISGAVQYHTDGRDVYQSYSPGAAMNRFAIEPSGHYRWGEKRGRLWPAKPWFGQAGVRYFEVEHEKFGTYILYYQPHEDKMIVLFDVGGQAAAGTRIGGTPPPPPPIPEYEPPRLDVEWRTGSSGGGRQQAPPPHTTPGLEMEWRSGSTGQTEARGKQHSTPGLEMEWQTGPQKPAVKPATPGDPCDPGPLGIVWAQCR